jgi:thiamine monophosphate synthase
MRVCEDYKYKVRHSSYTIGESVHGTSQPIRFYYISGPDYLGVGTIKDNKTLEEAVMSVLKREKLI